MILRSLVAFICGAIFTVGLTMGGMTQPAKIVGFLDVFGDWDYSLVFVMASAVGVYYIGLQLLGKRGKPFLATKFMLPTRKDIDPKSITGGILFGVGWGVSGMCPGPILSTLPTATPSVLVLALCMVVGLFISLSLSK